MCDGHAERRQEGGYVPAKEGGLSLPAPWYCTSSLQNHEKINLCCFNKPLLFLTHQFCDILLWKPWQTDTTSLAELLQAYLIFLHFAVFFFFFYKCKICDNPSLSKFIGIISPIASAHFVSVTFW